MGANSNGMWDFKSYDEKTWFRFLVLKFVSVFAIYILLHVFCNRCTPSYEYTKLSPEQVQLVTRMYMDSIQKAAQVKTDTPKKEEVKVGVCEKAMAYLNTVFEDKLEPGQALQVKRSLCGSSPQDITLFLAGTSFKVRSFFWLTNPCVYWEVIFGAIFGVLSSLLFSIGVVSRSTTTDLGNPRSVFDPSEIYSQVAKILYAPLCTLVVVLGYNLFTDKSIVDIRPGKGMIVFAFIGGFYSSRLIALMDRLKDVLLPNGSSALPAINQVPPVIPALTIHVQLDPSVPATVSSSITPQDLNIADVSLLLAGSQTPIKAQHKAGDPDGNYVFNGIAPGSYVISADLKKALPDGSQLHLTAGQLPPSNILSALAPIIINIK